MYYYYSKDFKNIDYSFSKEQDSIKKMKLFKVRFIYNPTPKGKYLFPVPKREFLFELKKVPGLNSKEIIEFVERFKKSENQALKP